MPVLAAVTGMVDFSGGKRIRKTVVAWVHMIGNIAAMLVEVVNLVLRPADDPGAIISPTGLLVSIVASVILGVTA